MSKNVLLIGVFILVGAVLAGATAAGVYFAADNARRAAIAEKMQQDLLDAENLEAAKAEVEQLLAVYNLTERKMHSEAMARLADEFSRLRNSPAATLDDFIRIQDAIAAEFEKKD